jgi:2-dehydro-3-deoxygluconokinase
MTDLLAVRPAEDCRWDCVALGEVMLRLDPGEGRIRTARSFQVWEGGGEYNVARGLRKTFGMRTSVVTALPRNEMGALAEDLILQGGVDTSHILWREADGIGRNTRMGLNFTERGFGVRGALGASDRANSAASQMRPDEVDWDALFGSEGVRWLHTGGIFAALSESTAATTLAAIRAARRHGVMVSYDLNHRASLWSSHPDPDAARRVNREIAGLVARTPPTPPPSTPSSPAPLPTCRMCGSSPPPCATLSRPRSTAGAQCCGQAASDSRHRCERSRFSTASEGAMVSSRAWPGPC